MLHCCSSLLLCVPCAGGVVKKFLLSLLMLFLTNSFVFAFDNSIFIPNISKDEVKKAIIIKGQNKNWQVRTDNNYTLEIYRRKSDSASMMLYGTGLNMHPEDRVNFTITEQNKGIMLSFNSYVVVNPNSGYEKQETAPFLEIAVNEMLKDLFIGHNSYEIKYKLKKDYVLVSDTPLTLYEDNKARIGRNYQKAVKIDDKDISEYSRSEINLLFNQCPKNKIKLNVIDDSTGEIKIFYLLKKVTPPEYKQYL